MSRVRRPDPQAVLARLKGFQRDAVEYAFHRLYGAEDSTHRFLISDEVGLGKTLVARGIVAKAIDHLWDSVGRIDVVYICSNLAIAEQNVRRLNLSGDPSVAAADRITMLPARVAELAKNKVNLVSFTPGTSFDLRSSQGVQRERRLLYWMMQAVHPIKGTGPMNLFQGRVRRTDRWREKLKTTRKQISLSEEILEDFAQAIRRRVDRDCSCGETDFLARYEKLCERFRYARKHIPREDRDDQSRFIGELRSLLARTCVDALEPDLVILDEFQRFKHLLDGDDDASLLAQQLFEYADEEERSQVRVLLLSATPYKMYTLRHEAEDDDHYADFLRTVSFLDPDETRHRRFEEALAQYRRELYRLGAGNGHELENAKARVERHLRRVMSRTERTGVTGSRDAMLCECPPTGVRLHEVDVRAFIQTRRIAEALESSRVVEYWKSAPYLVNLMDGYELDRALNSALGDPEKASELARVLMDASEARLPWDAVEAYGPLEPPNARLRALLAECLAEDRWKLLWVPPTLPYWRLGDFFERAREGGFTKRLLFSAWQVVPKAVATLLSYAAERAAITSLDSKARNTAEDRRRRRGLLRLTKAEGRLTGMPVLTLLYPSSTLAAIGDPLTILRACSEEPPRMSAATFVSAVRAKLEDLLAPHLADSPAEGPEDDSWYWAAPVLLDLEGFPHSRDWWTRRNLSSFWKARLEDGEDGDEGWEEHVASAKRVLDGWKPSGGPPADLLDVLAKLALAGPAVCALRSLARIVTVEDDEDRVLGMDGSGEIAWALRSLFNRPESMAVVRTTSVGDAYWKQVLDYCLRGGLTAVMDEYLHLVRDLAGLFDRPPAETIKVATETVCGALTLRSTPQFGRCLHWRSDRQTFEQEPRSLRTHFAKSFGRTQHDEQEVVQRNEQVRAAFNSPFWPFVLCSTSIGQEGLDFHAYCHAVVHWNLPSNPVDLEQREGRVHRYKGHAVRKNVASRYATEVLGNPGAEPWDQLFERARENVAGEDAGGLVPYWLYPIEGGAAIERHVPALPLTRDRAQLEALRRSLVLYRMVFGQPRQDDLLAYLLERVSTDVIDAMRGRIEVDLRPAKIRDGEGSAAMNDRDTRSAS